LRILAARMAEHGGDVETARVLWSATYQSTQDRLIRANAAAHLRAVQVDEEVPELERLVEAYRQKSGHWPATFADLATAGYIRGIPVDPLGNPYLLSANGRVLLRDPDHLPFVEKGLPTGYVAPRVPKIFLTD